MATAKRPRVNGGDGSSIFDIESRPPLTPAAYGKQPNNRRNYSAAVITPPPLPVNSHQPGAGFLDKCHFCGKRIPTDSEIFMYRDFCAFCSKECRNNQIKRNGLPEEQSILHKSHGQ